MLTWQKTRRESAAGQVGAAGAGVTADELFYKCKAASCCRCTCRRASRWTRRPRLGGLLVSTAPVTPCEPSRGVSPANSRFVSGELNVEAFFREYTAGMALADNDAAAAARRSRGSGSSGSSGS